MYNRGNLAEFELWHIFVMNEEGISPKDGRVGMVDGVPAPQNQRTVAYSEAIRHPSGTDDYIWLYGDYPDEQKDDLSEDDARNAGWFQNQD